MSRPHYAAETLHDLSALHQCQPSCERDHDLLAEATRAEARLTDMQRSMRHMHIRPLGININPHLGGGSVRVEDITLTVQIKT